MSESPSPELDNVSPSVSSYLKDSDNIRTVIFGNCCFNQVLHETAKPPGPGCPESLFLSHLLG